MIKSDGLFSDPIFLNECHCSWIEFLNGLLHLIKSSDDNIGLSKITPLILTLFYELEVVKLARASEAPSDLPCINI
jgi:hypothetical protein